MGQGGTYFTLSRDWAEPKLPTLKVWRVECTSPPKRKPFELEAELPMRKKTEMPPPSHSFTSPHPK